jgi:hypothetical protein
MTTIVVLALAVYTNAADVRVGVAADEQGQYCLAFPGPALAEGSDVTLVQPEGIDKVQHVFHARIVKAVDTCDAMRRQQYQVPMYELHVDNPPEIGIVAIALQGNREARKVGRQYSVRLTDTYPTAHVRSCASTEGIHLTLWSGTPLHSKRLWHEYWYLGYDTEPDCKPADYEGVYD